ncbi:hypothetical protein DXG01_013017 [Tephrocybe rancida]|nr:hypothetical protein DXG01_013017 [Tephrocybe rancida]
MTAPLSSRSLTNDDIEAVIQMATSSRASPDARTGPIKDTRTQLFVGNLPYRVRWQDLKDLFRRAGTVLRADVSLGPDNRSRGYGTVLLATAEDAGRAIDLFNGYSWQTRILEVRPDRLPPDYDANHPPPIVSAHHDDDPLEYSAILDLHHNYPASLSLRSLFVGNASLPFHCQWQDLKDLFRQAGAVMRADVALGQDGRSRGFGTVTFATEGDADRAVQMFNGYDYNGRTLKVNHDKFTQLAQNSMGPASLGTPSSSVSPASISPVPSIRSAPDSRVSLPTAYQARQLSSLTQSGKLPIGYHHLARGSASSSPAPFEVRQQKEKARDDRDRERERELLRSFSGLDIGLGTLSSHPASAPNASRSTSTSSTKPPSIATTSSTGSMVSSSSLAVSASTSNSSENSHLSFQHHRRLSSTKEQASSSPPPSSSAAAQSRLQTHRSPPRHPGPIALPPPPHVTSFSHSHTQPNMSPHGLPGFSPLHHPHSPLFHPMTHHQQQVEQIKQLQQHQITPLGLPPMTPSMPPFNFLPPGPGSPSASSAGHPYSPYAHAHPLPLPSPMQMPHMLMMHANGTAGSPLHHPLQHPPPPPPPHQRHPAPFGITPLSPPASATAPAFAAAASGTGAYSFSPGVAMSPGAFWGRPGGGGANPLMNPAVGAPVHAPEPTGYFDGIWYAPGASAGGGSGSSSMLANEILKDRDGDGDGGVLNGASGVGKRGGCDPDDDDDGGHDVKDGAGGLAKGGHAETDTDTDTGAEREKEKRGTGPRARRHSSTATTPWKTHPGDPEPEFRAWARDHREGTVDAVDLNSELAALVDGAYAISRTHSMTFAKPAERERERGARRQEGRAGGSDIDAAVSLGAAA